MFVTNKHTFAKWKLRLCNAPSLKRAFDKGFGAFVNASTKVTNAVQRHKLALLHLHGGDLAELHDGAGGDGCRAGDRNTHKCIYSRVS